LPKVATNELFEPIHAETDGLREMGALVHFDLILQDFAEFLRWVVARNALLFMFSTGKGPKQDFGSSHTHNPEAPPPNPASTASG